VEFPGQRARLLRGSIARVVKRAAQSRRNLV